MLPENDPKHSQMVRNVFAVENLRDETLPDHGGAGRLKLSAMISREFEERCSTEPFYGYAVPYNGLAGNEPKTHRFEARWIFGLAQDHLTKTGVELLEAEIVGALVGEMIAEVGLFAEAKGIMIFPCLISVTAIVVDPQTFDPCARFAMRYHSSPKSIPAPIDFTQSPAVVV